jgi:Ca2+/Na+ antiporter
VFQIHGVDAHGKVVVTKRLRREAVLAFSREGRGSASTGPTSPANSFILPRCTNAHLWGIICLYSPPRIRMNGLSIRKLFLIVICLLAASVLIDFAHMVLSMIIDSVLAVAIVYFLWRIKGQYEKRIKELEAEVRLLMSRRSGG